MTLVARAVQVWPDWWDWREGLAGPMLLLEGGWWERRERLAGPVRQNLKPKLEQKVRQNIGIPLTRSKAQQNWNREVDQCPHEAEYLRHRAGRRHFWFTCLQCGGRWERTELPSSSTT